MDQQNKLIISNYMQALANAQLAQFTAEAALSEKDALIAQLQTENALLRSAEEIITESSPPVE